MQSINLKGISKMLSSRNKTKTVAVAFILLLATSAILTFLPVFAQITAVPDRKTYPNLSVNPRLIGLNQELLVNLWVNPPPESPTLFAQAEGLRFDNVTVTFTKPDGSTDSFMPQEGNAVLPPGRTDRLGGIWFLYEPDQIGTWSVKFSFPGQTYVALNYSVYYEPCTSQATTFTVQEDLVLIGEAPSPLPAGYWVRPINADNREWSQLSGDWLQPYYDGLGTFGGTAFNPYSAAIDSPHIVWKNQVSQGGIVGGDWGSISYGAGGGSPGIIMDGKLYYNTPGTTFECVDLRTGKLLYQNKSGTLTIGQHLRADPGASTLEQEAATSVTAYLWGLETSQWKQYNAFTGQLVRTISNVPAGASGKARFFDGSEIVYAPQTSGFNTTLPYRFAVNTVIKWNLTKVPTSGTGANDWTKGIVWNVSVRQPDGFAPGDGRGSSTLHIVGDLCVVAAQNNEDRWIGLDLSTGTQLYDKTVDYIPISLTSYGRNPEGPFLTFDSSRTLYAYDMRTGNELWRTVAGEYPWGVDTQRAGAIQAYGNVYLGGYDGHIYAVDLATGDVKFQSDSSGNTTETPYGNWAFYSSFGGADGKIYAGTSEHSPTQPRIRGNKLFCFDANTGKELWNVSGAYGALSIADGYLVGTSENDGIQYCFGKGQTATTVSAPLTTVPAETGVLIQGTVMDTSPAQPNTPAVSDADMSAWMNYLHMQNADLQNVHFSTTGVPVELRAVGSNGAVIDLGTVTSDSDGQFATQWVPATAGLYKIYATFAGSGSYWSSHAATSLSVGQAAETPEQPEAAADNLALLYGILAAVVIAILIGLVAIVLVLRKH